MPRKKKESIVKKIKKAIKTPVRGSLKKPSYVILYKTHRLHDDVYEMPLYGVRSVKSVSDDTVMTDKGIERVEGVICGIVEQ